MTFARGELPTDTSRLVDSDMVEGTAVYKTQGEGLGSIYNFMVDMRSGKVEYMVMSFSSFLGIGNDYYPLPWRSLKYESTLEGYVVDLDENRMVGAPQHVGAD